MNTDPSDSNTDFPKNPSKNVHSGNEEPRIDLRSPDSKPLQLSGLAFVRFETESEFHPSIDEEVDFISDFSDLRFIEGLPSPEVLLRWLIADNVLVDCSQPIGLVPTLRYAEAGLFRCGASYTLSDLGYSAPKVTLGLYPRGIMWLKKNYIPRPERHQWDYVPPELRDSLK